MMHVWSSDHLTADQPALPFSFTYGGQASAPLLAGWPRTTASWALDSGRQQHTSTWTDPKTGLEVRCVAVAYAGYPVKSMGDVCT